MRAVKSFQPAGSEENNTLHIAIRIVGVPTLIEVRQNPANTSSIIICSEPKTDDSQLFRIVEWALFTELDVMPLYRLMSKDSKLKPLTRELRGLKPMRPVSLFEMAVIAITEQQISLAAAYKIRSRVIEHFGEPLGHRWLFPEPQAMAKAKLEDLKSCGLSGQKANYIHDFAVNIADGKLDLDILKTMDDDKARETIMNLRGFGRWSADYILIRGLARPDCVPADDLAIRSVIGEYLGKGQRLSPTEVTDILEPFRPYRGLLAFYLLAAHRLKPAASK